MFEFKDPGGGSIIVRRNAWADRLRPNTLLSPFPGLFCPWEVVDEHGNWLGCEGTLQHCIEWVEEYLRVRNDIMPLLRDPTPNETPYDQHEDETRLRIVNP